MYVMSMQRVTYITCRMYPACTCGTVSPLSCSNLATLILMELLRHAEFDVSRRAIHMVSSVTDIMNLVRSQDIMRDYFIVTDRAPRCTSESGFLLLPYTVCT